MRFWLQEPRRDPAGDGNQGGGGNAGTGSGEGNAATAGLTAESIAKMISDGVNAAVNGLDKKYKKQFEELKKPGTQQQQQSSAQTTDDDDDEAGSRGGSTGNDSGKQRKDPEVFRLKRQLEETNKRLADADAERAREKETAKAEKLDSALRRELSKYPIIDDDNFEAAHAAISRNVRYDDDGNIVGGADESPLKEYVEARMKKLNTMLRPKEVNGAGAANGGKQSSADAADIDTIKPGMKPEDKARIYAAIAAAKKGPQ